MRDDLSFACECGEVRGTMQAHEAGDALRCVCYCLDCQAFAFYLGAEDRVLDGQGGTDIYQTRPAWFDVSHGRDHLGCVELTSNGLKRFFATCCRTPLANVAGPRLPFIGALVVNFDPSRRDDLLPPVRTRLFTRDAHRAPPSSPAVPLPLIVIDLMRRTLAAWLGGDWNRHPLLSDDGSQIVPIRTLTPAERAALDRKAKERYAA